MLGASFYFQFCLLFFWSYACWILALFVWERDTLRLFIWILLCFAYILLSILSYCLESRFHQMDLTFVIKGRQPDSLVRWAFSHVFLKEALSFGIIYTKSDIYRSLMLNLVMNMARGSYFGLPRGYVHHSLGSALIEFLTERITVASIMSKRTTCRVHCQNYRGGRFPRRHV